MRAGCQQPDYMHCHPTGGAFYQTDDFLETKEGTDEHFRLRVDEAKWHSTNFQIKLFLERATEGKSSRGKIGEATHNAMQMNDEYMTHLQMFQKVEYDWGPMFKVVLEC